MLIATGQHELVKFGHRAILLGRPFESLADWAARTIAEEAAAEIVRLADARARLGRRQRSPRNAEMGDALAVSRSRYRNWRPEPEVVTIAPRTALPDHHYPRGPA